MTKEQLLKKLLQLKFKLIETTEKYEVYEGHEIQIRVYDYITKTSWYIGDIKHQREHTRRSFVWNNKRYTSKAYSWDQIGELEKQIKNGKFIH